MLDIATIKELCKNGKIVLTTHVRARMKERDIKYSNVIPAILNGEIIEQYTSSAPYPSCLVLGYIGAHKPLHVVLSVDNGCVWVITTYWPTLDKWEDDYKTRKAVN
jgi:hypothetical protein